MCKLVGKELYFQASTIDILASGKGALTYALRRKVPAKQFTLFKMTHDYTIYIQQTQPITLSTKTIIKSLDGQKD